MHHDKSLYTQTVIAAFVAGFAYLVITALGHGNTVAAATAMLGTFVALLWMLSPR